MTTQPDLGPADYAPFTLTHHGWSVTLPGQPTACPYLAVVPVLTAGGYSGGFTLAHRPTGLYLNAPTGYDYLTPDGAQQAAARLAGLDWSSPDRMVYDHPAGAHKAAWLALLPTRTAEQPGARRVDCWTVECAQCGTEATDAHDVLVLHFPTAADAIAYATVDDEWTRRPDGSGELVCPDCTCAEHEADATTTGAAE